MTESGITVIKLGGHAMDEPGLLAAFCADVAQLAASGHKLVIAHGGGPRINSLLRRLNLESRFVNGLRVTDSDTLDAVEMALCGAVNKYLVRQLLEAGIKAVGISGEDGRLLCAVQKDPLLGFVGSVAKVNPGIIYTLLSGGFLPVIAPLALSPDGELLNVNADTAAGAIAGALAADRFVLISDVPGVLDDEGSLLKELNPNQIANLTARGIISGGMLPKVECCQLALGQGCKSAIILDGSRKSSLALCLGANDIAGTVITAN